MTTRLLRKLAALAVLAGLCAACQSADALHLSGPCAPDMIRLHTAF